MPDLTGQSLDRYNILEKLGQGGMATVYKAHDTRLERDVAVKVIRTDEFAPAILERILLRFEREAKALARLTHPNIVHVLDYGEQNGVPYLVMDYLSGGTLKDRLGKPIPWRDVVRMLLPVGDALAFAHERGILHRDVKPSNILLTEKGQPLLSDFGIAKIIDEESVVDLTGTSTTVGTPEYMAPEQVTSKEVDPRADMYALGVVFYEMITGRKPFKADTPMAVLFKHASDPLPPPGQYIDNLPQAVEDMLYKALAKKPEDRYPDMAAFVKSLEELLETTALGAVDKQAITETATFQPGDVDSAMGAAAQKEDVTLPPVTPASQGKKPATPTPEMPAWLNTPAAVPQKRASSRAWVVWLLGIILLCGLLTVIGLVAGGYGMQGKGPLAFLQASTPTLPPEPIPGLAGHWQDTYETTVHTIEWDGSQYVVTDSTHPERGTYEIIEQSWDGLALLWTYRVPDGADVTLETLSVDGDELFLNWWSTNGNSGQDTFLRYP